MKKRLPKLSQAPPYPVASDLSVQADYFMSSVPIETDYIMRIDRHDVVTYVNQVWLDFAQANEAPQLTGNSVIGRRLWGMVQDLDVRHLYRLLLEKVRKRCVAVGMPFRCDSLDSRRYMAMDIVPLGIGALEFRSRFEWEEKRPAQALLSASVPRTAQNLYICSWCKKVRPVVCNSLDLPSIGPYLNMRTPSEIMIIKSEESS